MRRFRRIIPPIAEGMTSVTSPSLDQGKGRRIPVKKHKPEEIIGKLREVEIVLDQGGTTAEACRRTAVSAHT